MRLSPSDQSYIEFVLSLIWGTCECQLQCFFLINDHSAYFFIVITHTQMMNLIWHLLKPDTCYSVVNIHFQIDPDTLPRSNDLFITLLINQCVVPHVGIGQVGHLRL